MRYLLSALSVAAVLIGADAAGAQVTNPTRNGESTNFVASYGDDSATYCLRSTPCRTLDRAIAKTRPGGAVVCLDAFSSGTVQIDRSITIDCPGAVIGSGSRDGNFVIDAVVASDDSAASVTLRNIHIVGNRIASPSSLPLAGVLILNARDVTLENVVIEQSRQQGIIDRRTGGQTKLFIKNSTIKGSGGAGFVAAAQAVGIVVLDDVRLENNNYGIAVATGNNVVINRSVISGNVTAGVEADPGGKVELSNSVVSHSNTGVQAFGTVRLRENDIKFTNTAIQGTTRSMGANRFSGNGTIGTPPTLASGAQSDVYD